MKMTYICIAYFLTNTLNVQKLWGRENYLLDRFVWNWKKLKTNVNSKESVSSNDKKIKDQKNFENFKKS